MFGCGYTDIDTNMDMLDLTYLERRVNRFSTGDDYWKCEQEYLWTIKIFIGSKDNLTLSYTMNSYFC